MRRFRFVGDPGDYSPGLVEYNHIYEGYEEIGSYTVITLSYDYPNDWREVIDEPETTLHQTDLGYYAGLALNGYMANIFDSDDMHRHSEEKVAEWSINYAKELIKQLKEEEK